MPKNQLTICYILFILEVTQILYNLRCNLIPSLHTSFYSHFQAPHSFSSYLQLFPHNVGVSKWAFRATTCA